jgi:tetratricopeptide (TPR) repeat protein
MSDEDQLRRALDDARRSDGNVLQAFADLANHYRDRQAWDPLIALTEERYQLDRATSGASVSLVYLAIDMMDAERGELAVELLDRTRRDFEADGVGDEFALRTLWTTTARVMNQLDRIDEAIAACRRTVEIARRVGPEYSDYWEMHAFLADLVQFRKRDVAGCIPERTALWQHFRRVLEQGELGYNATIVHAQNAVRLAHALRKLERWAEARAIYEPLLADITASMFLGPDSIERPTLMLDLAECHRALGDSGKARELALYALELLEPHGDRELSQRARALLD